MRILLKRTRYRVVRACSLVAFSVIAFFFTLLFRFSDRDVQPYTVVPGDQISFIGEVYADIPPGSTGNHGTPGDSGAGPGDACDADADGDADGDSC